MWRCTMALVECKRINQFAMNVANSQTWKTPVIVLVAGCLVSVVGLGVRSGLGLYLYPMAVECGWTHEPTDYALALPNIL